MPSPSAKLISAGIVTESDLWRITAGVTAVNPTKYQAVVAYATSLGFGPYMEWLSRGYQASRKSFSDDAARAMVVLHQAGPVPVNCLPKVNAITRKLVTDVASIVGGNYTFSGRGTHRFIERSVLWTDGVTYMNWTGAITSPTGQVLQASGALKSSRVDTFQTFADVAPLGTQHSGTIVSRNIGGGGGGITSQIYSTERAVTVGADVTSLATQTQINWPLIEGPSVITFGEIINWADLTFEYFGATMADLAKAVRSASNRWGYTPEQLAKFLTSCDAQPAAGVVLFRAGTKPLNPFFLIDGARDAASDALAGAGTVDGIDYSLVRSKWVAGAECVAGFSPYTRSKITVGSVADQVIAAIGDNPTAAWAVSADSISLLLAPAITVAMAQAVGVVRQLSTAGIPSIFSTAASANSDVSALSNVDKLNAAVMEEATHQTVALDVNGTSAGIGPALVTGLTQPLSSSQIKVARAFVAPAYLTLT